MTQYVAYRRVSTDQQGIDGNGMAAQEDAIARFIKAKPESELLESFIEVESGKNCARPELDRAIAFAKKHKAKLLIAKLDRLSRSVAFISKLMETQVDFVCCDMPEATPLVIHIMASFAEEERRRISQRTREGLAQLKKQGVKLGSPHPERGGAVSKERANEFAKQWQPKLIAVRGRGRDQKSFAKVARELNADMVPGPGGKRWHATTVERVLKRVV